MLTNIPAGTPNLSNPILLMDGTVIAHQSCLAGNPTAGTNWYKLTPVNGNYINGTWTQIASLPNGFAPRFFGSSVLPDGRVIIEGGEYVYDSVSNTCKQTDTNTQGAIYDPVADAWTPVTPPSGWTSIGDAGGIVLDNGTYLQTSCCDGLGGMFTSAGPHASLLDANTLTWTPTGTNKFDVYDEEAIAKLPSGNLLTVDAYVQKGFCGLGSELYTASTGVWSSAGFVPNLQSDCQSPANSDEVGPSVLRPDGTAVSFSGVTNGNTVGNVGTSIYNSSNGAWSSGSAVPSVGGVPYTLADAPAAVLPDGNILYAASPSTWTNVAGTHFPPPTHFFEMDLATNTMTQVPDMPGAANVNAFQVNFLVLPGGQVLAMQTDTPTVAVYVPQGSAQTAWQPVITSVPTSLVTCGTYTLSGAQLNGRTEG